MFPAITSGSSGSAMDRLAKRARLEWVDPARRSANWVSALTGPRRARLRGVFPLSLGVLTTASLLHHQQGLLRAVGMFLTGIIVARNFGDAFNV